jgi:hypothetical protein
MAATVPEAESSGKRNVADFRNMAMIAGQPGCRDIKKISGARFFFA